jgi:1-acyl-sn-glycerol-3-phosphate acyltransferase
MIGRWLLTLARRFWYWLTTVVVRMSVAIANDARCIGIQNWPKEGGALICANHQSYLDPILIGSVCPRSMNYLARESLFRFKPLAALMRLYHAIPLQREGLGIGGLKESLRRLRSGEQLLIFPEGTRSPHGGLQELQPGFTILARRGHVPIVPVGIDGSFEMWPRKRRWPTLTGVRLRFVVGTPITEAEIAEMTDEHLLQVLHSRIADLLIQARKS